LLLIDGSGYIFRAYHALPPLTRPRDGAPVGAVSGFCNMLYKLVQDVRLPGGPSHLAVIFDSARKTFRSDIYPEYKAHRPEPPEDLRPQFALIRDAVRAFDLPSIEFGGLEADDLIASYARAAVKAGLEVTIISSDKDLMQLVSPGISMLDPMKNKHIGPAEVVEKFGVPPEKVVDVQALAGDSADNVPGIPGIGLKTAAELIQTYGDLDNLLARAGEIKQPKRRENLIAFADLARVSRQLVQLKEDADLPEAIETLKVKLPDAERLLSFLEDMGFKTLARRVSADYGVAPGPSAESTLGPASSRVVTRDPSAQAKPGAILPGLTDPIDRSKYACVTDLAVLDHWIARAFDQGVVAFDTETTDLDAMRADLVGVSLALGVGDACYIPLGHRAGGGGLDFAGAGAGPAQIPKAEALARLKPLLEADSVLKIGQNIKYDMLVLHRLGIAVGPIDDTMLMSYVLDNGVGMGDQRGHGMDALSERHLGHQTLAFKDVTGTGKTKITFDDVALDKATEYAAEDADVTWRLAHVLKPRLGAEAVTTVYETLERALVPVLVGMEAEGILVDRAVLARLSGEFATRMGELETQVHGLAGGPFNLGSPKQLGEILFERLSLPGGKRTKTGAWSTDADVLEELAAQGHELPARLMDWRQLAKLKGTYTDALPGYIHPQTGRVHTSYAMASTSTGRLASSDPNLQNIPIRTEEGRKIRQAFIAPPGKLLVSADYSQIELRLLAHIAGIDALKSAFAKGMDIHAMTASEMFGVPVEGMDPSVRRRAKAINFGIIYGISAFGLAAQLSIPQSEARQYIETYFKRFPGIRAYMDDTRETARRLGRVETIFGRKIHMPAINDKNPSMRGFMERAAINAPIQGSAADVIRRAMVKINPALTKAGLDARMLLQVHDELIFEVPEDQAEKTCALVAEVMEQAALPALAISVPLTVDARAGRSWDEAH
jgi:DNA polymerase-1